MSIKRFGARYGLKTKKKFAQAEAQQRRKYKCPACLKASVTRKAMGIWHCSSCGAKIAGKAYSL